LYTGIGYVKLQHKDDKSSLKGAWSGLYDPLFNFGSSHVFGICEVKHFKCHVPTDTEEH